VRSLWQILRALHFVLRPEHFDSTAFSNLDCPEDRKCVTVDAEYELGIGFFFQNPKSVAQELRTKKWGRGVDAAGEFHGRAVFLPPADCVSDDRQCGGVVIRQFGRAAKRGLCPARLSDRRNRCVICARRVVFSAG